MVYCTEILPTGHYLEEHADDVAWDKVVEIILSTKNPRKKGENYEIEKDGYYVLFRIVCNKLYVINAKSGR